MCDQTTTAHSPPCLISTLSPGTHAESSQGTPPTTSYKSLLVCWPRTSSAGTGLNPHAFERWWPGTARGQAFASAAQKLAGPSA